MISSQPSSVGSPSRAGLKHLGKRKRARLSILKRTLLTVKTGPDSAGGICLVELKQQLRGRRLDHGASLTFPTSTNTSRSSSLPPAN